MFLPPQGAKVITGVVVVTSVYDGATPHAFAVSRTVEGMKRFLPWLAALGFLFWLGAVIS